MPQNVDIAVIGAGVVGLTCALRLAQAGRDVVVIDPNPAGSGASFGNAGTIADYAVMPLGTPAVLRDLPRLLLDSASPLAIRRASILALAPWLARFVLASLPRPAARNAANIAGLLADAGQRWQDLAAEVGAGALLQDRGAIYVYETAQAWRGAQADMAQRRALGVAVDLISGNDLAALEPNLPPAHGAAYFRNARFLSDPAAMMGALAAQVSAAGAGFHSAKIIALDRTARGISLRSETGEAITAGQVILAAGAHSKPLARMAGDRVPLDTERGYHVEWDMDAPLLSRPCCLTARGFYFCPMQGRLRVAGTVELGGLTAPSSKHRLALLEAGARRYFPNLGAPNRTWMGFRPSLPDSLPVIGAGRDGRVFHAFGHGHIGVTLAPITADMITAAVAGKALEGGSAGLATACSPLRF